jgi:hypothetical protein
MFISNKDFCVLHCYRDDEVVVVDDDDHHHHKEFNTFKRLKTVIHFKLLTGSAMLSCRQKRL